MYALPVLMLTQDAALWQHWQQVAGPQWLPARGTSLADLERWKQQGRHLAILDASLPQLPQWGDARWSSLLGEMKLLVLSSRPSDDVGRQVLAAGASGYAHAYSTPATLGSILQSIATGNIWLGRSCCSACCRMWAPVCLNPGCSGPMHCPSANRKWHALRPWGTAMRKLPTVCPSASGLCVPTVGHF
jgi:hypothetical protein